MLKREQYVYVGVDLHKQRHVAVMGNCWGEPLHSFIVDNAPNKFPSFLRTVRRKARDKGIIFGLEDTTFYGRTLAQFLLDQGEIVKEVNSSFTKRERFSTTSPDKTDVKDATAICSTLARLFHTLPDAKPHDLYWVLNQLLTSYESFKKQSVRLQNSIQNQLIHHYPSYKKFFPDVTTKTAIAFFKRYPSPHLLEDISLEELTSFLKKEAHPSLSIEKVKHLLAVVHETGYRKSEFQASQNILLQTYFSQLKTTLQCIKHIELEMDQLMKHASVQLQTFMGVSTILAATFLAEIGDIHRFPNAKKLAKLAGVAPTNYSSGDRTRQGRNLYGKRRLNHAFYMLALQHVATKRNGEPRNPIMHAYYKKKQEEGRKPKQALIFVMRRLVNMIYKTLKTESIAVEITKK